MYLENSVGKVYYEVHGAENEGPVVFFAHGVSMDHRTFEPQVEALKERYKVIVWDMPYHGLSSPIDFKLSFVDTAADYAIQILDQLQIDQAVLVGQSLGSFVAQQAVYKYPARIMATVHIGGAPLYPKTTSLLQALIPMIPLFINLYPEKMIFRAFAKHKALKTATRKYLEESASRNGKRVMIHLTQEMLRDMVRGLPDSSQESMLLCYGDHDAPFLKRMSISWHKRTSGSKLAVIRNAHHIANQDNPEGFNEVLTSFLASLG